MVAKNRSLASVSTFDSSPLSSLLRALNWEPSKYIPKRWLNCGSVSICSLRRKRKRQDSKLRANGTFSACFALRRQYRHCSCSSRKAFVMHRYCLFHPHQTHSNAFWPRRLPRQSVLFFRCVSTPKSLRTCSENVRKTLKDIVEFTEI